MDWKALASREDASVNFVRNTPDGGALECRFVRRESAYAIAYVSSHTGCRNACRFCHLTQTGQTSFTPATLGELTAQVDRVLAHMDAHEAPAERLHVNFMARGDALSSDVVTGRFDAFASHVTAEASARGMEVRFNISTIFPPDSEGTDLARAFGKWPVTFFWSLYSLDPAFRRRWLPRARYPGAVATDLRAWQAATGREIVFHWAFIEGENDDAATTLELRDWIAASGIEGRFNLVRYNSHGDRTGREPGDADLERLFETLRPAMRREGSRIVPRVGFDVKASCGMFVSPDAT